MFVAPVSTLSLGVSALVHSADTQSSSKSSFAGQGASSASAQSQPAARRNVSSVQFDKDAKRVIIQQIHANTGAVVSQYPSEAQLKIRQYVAVAAENAPPSHTSLEA